MPATHSRHRRSKQTPEQIARTRQKHIVLLSLLVVLVFASTLGGGFVWSDREDILQGATPHCRAWPISRPRSASRARPTAAVTCGGLHDPASGTWQPLTLLSNTLSWSLWGDCSSLFPCRKPAAPPDRGDRPVRPRAARAVATPAWPAHRRLGGCRVCHPPGHRYQRRLDWRPSVSARGRAGGLEPGDLHPTAGDHQVTSWTRQSLADRAMCVTALGAMLAHESAYLLPLLALLVAGYESKERGRSSVTGIAPRRLLALGLLLATLLLVVLYRNIVLGGLGFSSRLSDRQLHEQCRHRTAPFLVPAAGGPAAVRAGRFRRLADQPGLGGDRGGRPCSGCCWRSGGDPRRPQTAAPGGIRRGLAAAVADPRGRRISERALSQQPDPVSGGLGTGTGGRLRPVLGCGDRSAANWCLAARPSYSCRC